MNFDFSLYFSDVLLKRFVKILLAIIALKESTNLCGSGFREEIEL